VYSPVRTSTDAPNELNDLVKEIAMAVATRRVSILRSALGFAEALFRKGPERYRNLVAADCDRGRWALLTEADYAREDPGFDVPGIRAASFRLALAMDRAGRGEGAGVRGWIDAAADDPLPELRNAAVRRIN
jgi:hypothetical protein